MIIPDDQIDKKIAPTSSSSVPGIPVIVSQDQTNIILLGSSGQNEDPPPYQAPTKSGNAARNNDFIPQKPCNFMYVSRSHGAIKETVTVDPALQIPPALLSKLASNIPESERDNLNFNTSNGAVAANVWIVNNLNTTEASKRVRIAFRSSNGSIKAKILPTVETMPMPKFIVTASTSNGSILVHIPRSFTGPISANTSYGSITLSDELQQQATTFSDGSEKKCFVGDLHQYEGSSPEVWDELRLNTSFGSIKVAYADEAVVFPEGWKGFWSRLLGL